ncbi:MAG: hypothetical protein ACI9ND_002070 [Yoonia sp.]|jgi:hypothetical protein
MKITLLGSFCLGIGCAAIAQRPPLREHTATQSQLIVPVAATERAGTNVVALTKTATTRTIFANGIPDHLVGAFPNPGNPNMISEQQVNLQVPLSPTPAQSLTSAQGWVFGVSVKGVVFDPFAAEFWQGNPRSGWNYDALGGAVPLGVDANYAHVQPQGTYHYHGVPFGLLALLRYDASRHSPLVGYAADGYPIYALTGILDGQLTQVASSYVLKSGARPGGDAPTGDYDGAFVQDYEYVSEFGDLDTCNGAFTQSAEYPNGTYAYFLTPEFPFVPRCFTGTPDAGFKHGF